MEEEFVGLRSCGSLPVTTSKTAASPSVRRSSEASSLKDFRLPALVKLLWSDNGGGVPSVRVDGSGGCHPLGPGCNLLFFRGVCIGAIS